MRPILVVRRNVYKLISLQCFFLFLDVFSNRTVCASSTISSLIRRRKLAGARDIGLLYEYLSASKQHRQQISLGPSQHLATNNSRQGRPNTFSRYKIGYVLSYFALFYSIRKFFGGPKMPKMERRHAT